MPVVRAQNTAYDAVFDHYEFAASSFGDQFCQPIPNAPLMLNGNTITFDERYPCASGLNVTGTITLSQPDHLSGVIASFGRFVLDSPTPATVSAQATFKNGTAALEKTQVAAGIQFQGDNCNLQPSDETGVGVNSTVTKDGSGTCTLSELSVDYEADGSTPKSAYFYPSGFVTVQTTPSTDTSLLTEFLVRVVYRLGPPGAVPTISALDQKLAGAGATIDLNIHGNGFSGTPTVEFLNAGQKDPHMTVTVKTVSATEIQATLATDDFQSTTEIPQRLGARDLRITQEGTPVTLPNAIYVTSFTRLSLDQTGGRPNSVFGEDFSYDARIANHPTIVSMNANAGSAPARPDRLTGLLYVFDGQNQIPGSPFAPSQPLRPDLNPNYLAYKDPANRSDEDYFFLRDSFNFYFGMASNLPSHEALTEGSYTFWVGVSTTDPTTVPQRLPGLTKDDFLARGDLVRSAASSEQRFFSTRPLRLYVIVDPRLSTFQANALYNLHERDFEFLAAAYPIDGSRSKFDVRRAGYSTLDIDDLKPKAGEKRNWADKIIERMQEMLSNLNGDVPDERRFDHIVLLLRNGALQELVGADYQGYGRIIGAACMVATNNEQALAHEIGHNLGLDDTYKKFPPAKPRPNPRKPGAFNDGNTVEHFTVRTAPLHIFSTYPVVSRTLNKEGTLPSLPDIPFRFIDIMGAPTINWPDEQDQKYLGTKFRLIGAGVSSKEATRGVAAESSSDVVEVNGFIDTGDQVSVTSVKHAVLPLPTSNGGDFILELLDGSGQSISATPFAVDFDVPELGLVPEVSFTASTPFAAGATTVRIRHGDNVIFSRAISGNPPSVQILSPGGGEVLNGPFTISWTAGDPDGDALSYSIVYLHDDGTPSLIADHLSATAFQWNDPGQSGGSNNGRIIVTANDGFNQASSTSSPFSVSKGSPILTILSPQTGSAVPAGTEVTLSGAGSDPEDGYLPGSSLSFHSSVDGELGSGGVVVRTLSEGTHTITLTGVDSDGVSAETSITLTVGGASAVLAIDSISPASGAAGTPVSLNGRNFSAGATVRFGGTNATVTNVTASQITAVVPSGLKLGDTEVTVTSGGFTAPTVPFQVIYGRPLLTSLRPDHGPPGTPVYLSGAEFDPTSSGNSVTFGNTAATVIGAGLHGLVVSVPPGLIPSNTNVVVTTSQGASDPLPFTVTSGDPASPVVIRSISPDSGKAATLVTLSGSGFSSSRSSNAVSFGDVVTSPVSATADTLQVAVPFGINPGTFNVVVIVNGYPSNAVSFTVSSPTPTPGPTVAGCAAVPNNLISWWRADGDASDNAGTNPGTLQGGATATTTGKVGQAFSFSGNGTYVSLGNPASLSLTGAMSIEGWINPSAGPGSNLLSAIMTKWAQDASPVQIPIRMGFGL